MSRIRDFYERFASVANTRISARATTGFMKPGQKVRTAEERAQFYPNPASGPGTLRRMSGRLASSITGADFTGDREGIFNVVVRDAGVQIEKGSKVPYAGMHEFGFSGSVTIPAHTRTITQAFGRAIEPRQVQVNSFVRGLSVPARPYLRPAIDQEEKFLMNWLADNYRRVIESEVRPNE